MALLDRFKKQGPPKAKDAPAKEKKEKKPKESAESKKSESKEERVVPVNAKAAAYAHVLTRPHVSEKAAILAEQGRYVFDVPVSANKTEIKRAVEAVYSVHVESVRTQRGIGKAVVRGKIRGRRKSWKKAVVELKKGETIALMEHV